MVSFFVFWTAHSFVETEEHASFSAYPLLIVRSQFKNKRKKFSWVCMVGSWSNIRNCSGSTLQCMLIFLSVQSLWISTTLDYKVCSVTVWLPAYRKGQRVHTVSLLRGGQGLNNTTDTFCQYDRGRSINLMQSPWLLYYLLQDSGPFRLPSLPHRA
jgi:hypothetical protein